MSDEPRAKVRREPIRDEVKREFDRLAETFAAKQELLIVKTIEAQEEAKQKRIAASVGILLAILGTGLVGFFAFLYGAMKDSAVTAAQNTARAVAQVELQKVEAESTILKTALASVTQAQETAIEARTTTKSVLVDAEGSLGRINDLLSQIRGADETVELLEGVQEPRELIERILRDPETLALFSSELTKHVVPAGTVAAFALRKCPEGWVPFNQGIGRMIVGAGDASDGLFGDELSDREVCLEGTEKKDAKKNLMIGGAETVTLIKEQMPAHTHESGRLRVHEALNYMHMSNDPDSISQTPGDTRIHGLFGPTHKINFGAHDHEISGATGSAGQGGAHENMPPYIALYFCTKS